jgi:hypothetical protein
VQGGQRDVFASKLTPHGCFLGDLAERSVILKEMTVKEMTVGRRSLLSQVEASGRTPREVR